MAKSLNKVQLIGRLGRDPEMKYTASGTAFCKFSIATDESWNNKGTGEREERTEWHNLIAWGKLAEICSQYLVKGSLIYVEGSIQSSEYDDKQGVKRRSYDIRLKDMVMLGGKAAESGGRTRAADSFVEPPVGGSGGFISDDDIPF